MYVWASLQAGGIHTLNILFLQHQGIHPEGFQRQAPLNCWPGLAFWTIPAEILSPSQEHLCKLQILRPDTQGCHCCAGLLTDGQGIKTERQRYRFDFSRHRVPFVTHKERRLLLVRVKGGLWGRLVWLCAPHSDNKTDSNPLLGPLFNLYFGKLEEILRLVWIKNTNSTHTNTQELDCTPFPVFIIYTRINKHTVSPIRQSLSLSLSLALSLCLSLSLSFPHHTHTHTHQGLPLSTDFSFPVAVTMVTSNVRLGPVCASSTFLLQSPFFKASNHIASPTVTQSA